MDSLQQDYNGEAILQHLMLQKSILRDEGFLDVGYYADIINNMKSGDVLITDPVERSVAVIFELVMENHLDPWKINIVEFTKMYMDKINDTEDINFITAGVLVKNAWEILYLKSENVMEDMLKLPVDSQSADTDDFFIPPDEGLEMFFDDAGPLYGAQDAPLESVSVPEVPEDKIVLKELGRRHSKRPVTLMELLNAFEEAQFEIEIRKQLEKSKSKLLDKKNQKPSSAYHKENVQKNIIDAWARICEMELDEMPFSKIWDGTRADAVKIFTSLLILQKYSKVRLYQEKAYSEVYIEVLVPYGMRDEKSISDVIRAIRTEGKKNSA